MPINFPDSPSANDTHTVGDKTWIYNGSSWDVVIANQAPNQLRDADNDTKIETENTADDDTLRFSTAGTERMTITSAGHLIPSANVTYDLGSATYRFRDIYLSGTTIDLGGVTISSDGTNITLPPVSNISGDLTVGTDVLHVDHANSRVGIGTTSPDDKLHVAFTNGITAGVVLTNSGNTVGKQGMRISFDNDRLTFQRASDTGAFEANYVAIDQDTGNVGIGTITPGSTLSISGTNTNSVPIIDIQTTGSGGYQRGVRLLNSGLANGEELIYAVGQADSARNMGQVYFAYTSSGSTSNRLSLGIHSVDDVLNILGTGNVGIGTTSPTENLHVSGSARVDGALKLYGQTTGDGLDRTGYGNYIDKVALVLSPAANDGAVAILFPSIGNTPSDYAYIAYDEDYGEAGVAAGENGVLVIGSENDGSGSSDHVRVKSRLVVEADNASSDPAYALQVKASNTTADLLSVDRSGRVLAPSNPLFSGTTPNAVNVSSVVATSANAITQVDYNVGNCFNASNGRFTAPVAGYYEASVHFGTNAAAAVNVRIRKNGTANTGPLAEAWNQGGEGAANVAVRSIIYCNAGDYIDFELSVLNCLSGVQHKRFLIRLVQ